MRNRIVLCVCLVSVLAQFAVARERIFTWVDENGHIRHTVIRETDPESLDAGGQSADEPGAVQAQDAAGAPEAQVAPADPAQRVESTPQASAGAVAPRQAAPAEKAISGDVARDQKLQDGARKPNEDAEGAGVASGIAGADVSPGASGASAKQALKPGPEGTYVLDGEVYEDAAALEARGFSRKDRPRFMTWVDATGQVRSDPLPAAEEDQSPPKVREEEPVILARTEPVPADLAAGCCKALTDVTFNHLEMPGDDPELLIRFERDEPVTRLLGSETPFRLITLPESTEGTIYRVRTFVGKKAVYPTLVTLDKDFRPVRVLRDVVYRYEPRTWFRHAFIEGYIALAPGERHLVVFMDDADLVRQTVTIGLSEEPIVVRHGRVGDLHFLAVR